MIAALVPVRGLGDAKSRLRAALSSDARSRLRTPLPSGAPEALARAMLEDVIGALRAVPAVDVVAVVTGDEHTASVAEKTGARALLRPEAGLNPSLDAAANELAGEGLAALLVLLGDVAGATPADLARLFEARDDLGGRGVVLAPSDDGGSAALLRAPHDLIPNAFGPDSAARHRALARAARAPLRELALPSLALDLDSAEDLDAFLAAPGAGARTRALLAELGWGRR